MQIFVLMLNPCVAAFDAPARAWYNGTMHFVTAKAILSPHNGMNLYRGCTHGCIYCDSRSDCYQFTHPFEDVAVKQNAPELLEAALRRKRTKCMIGTGSMCDPYLPLEKELRLTRRSLEIIARHGFGVAVQTKSDLVLRDLDLLDRIQRTAKAVVQMTVTTHDDALCRLIEPQVCPTSRRFAVLSECKRRGIPTVVWLSPILPFINDTAENIRGILDGCVRAGVHAILCFGMGVTLRSGDREYFYASLDRHFPGIKERYIRAFGDRYEVTSPRNAELMRLLADGCASHGIMLGVENVFAYLHEFPQKSRQLELF